MNWDYLAGQCWTAAALVGLTCLGCGLPRDPEGAWERIRGGEMRVGVSEHPPWTRWEDGEPSGIEVQLLRDLGNRLDARIQWRRGAESELVEALERGELDVVIGGVKDSTPWSSHAAATRPYVTFEGEDYVLLVPHGENRWLLELDRFLHGRETEVRNLLKGQVRR
jgi:ABC-type amino acid transport substrate-binding protein